MSLSRFQATFRLLAGLILFGASTAVAADVSDDIRPIPSKRPEMEKRFLLRTSDELNITLLFVHGTIDLLNKQIEAEADHKTENKSSERFAFVAWYQKYAGWLEGMSLELDQVMTSYYAQRQESNGWAAFYEELNKAASIWFPT